MQPSVFWGSIAFSFNPIGRLAAYMREGAAASVPVAVVVAIITMGGWLIAGRVGAGGSKSSMRARGLWVGWKGFDWVSLPMDGLID